MKKDKKIFCYLYIFQKKILKKNNFSCLIIIIIFLKKLIHLIIIISHYEYLFTKIHIYSSIFFISLIVFFLIIQRYPDSTEVVQTSHMLSRVGLLSLAMSKCYFSSVRNSNSGGFTVLCFCPQMITTRLRVLVVCLFHFIYFYSLNM